MKHMMVDIETMSTRNNAAILSIGCVRFDADTLYDRFHVGIELADNARHGRHLDPDTIMWWMSADRDAARKELVDLGRVDLFSALDGFRMLVQETPKDEFGYIWGNGATFDNVILRSACDAVGVDYPVSYKKDACYRTVSNLAPEIAFERVGTHHSGLADAESQALHLQKICKDLGIKL